MQALKDAKIITSVFNAFEKGSAVIAGGFLRDVDTGRTPKDIDILIEWSSESDYREAEILADRLGYTILDYSEGYGECEDEQLRCVYKLSKAGCLDIDLIFLNCDVMTRINNFPTNSSRVWLEGEIKRHTKEYERFITDKLIIVYDNCPLEYFERMQSYYPNYFIKSAMFI